MPKILNNQTQSTAIVDKQGKPTIAFFTLLEGIVNLEILDGTGTPETFVKARFKTWYVDTANAPATVDVYFKSTNESVATGWVLT